MILIKIDDNNEGSFNDLLNRVQEYQAIQPTIN